MCMTIIAVYLISPWPSSFHSNKVYKDFVRLLSEIPWDASQDSAHFAIGQNQIKVSRCSLLPLNLTLKNNKI